LLLLKVACGEFQVDVALLVGSSGTKASANVRGPSSSSEEKDGEDDAETETEGRLDEEIGQAAIPLKGNVRTNIHILTLLPRAEIPSR
jgi:hypothetical protein